MGPRSAKLSAKICNYFSDRPEENGVPKAEPMSEQGMEEVLSGVSSYRAENTG